MSHKQIIFTLFILYILGMTAAMIYLGIGIAPDRYAFVLLFASLIVRRTRTFLLDWIPFLFILITYDFLRGFADNVNGRVHLVELINWERTIFFGHIPTADLQSLLYHPSSPSLLDYIATIFYFLHFALAESFAFLLWIKNRHQFYEFTLTLVTMSLAGWVIYILYPSAPPWMAAQQGHLPGVHKILDVTLATFPEKVHLPTIYHQLNPNPVAAFPSMHAAYPTLIFLFALQFFGKKAWWFIFYVLGLWFSVIYLGEHYGVDVLGGALYGVFFYLLARFIFAALPWKSAHTPKIKKAAHQ